MRPSEKFELACKQIKERDGIKALEYNLLGSKKDKPVLLKTSFRNVATKYLYFEQANRPNYTYLFAWQQVTDACKLADLYVTDVIKKYY